MNPNGFRKVSWGKGDHKTSISNRFLQAHTNFKIFKDSIPIINNIKRIISWLVITIKAYIAFYHYKVIFKIMSTSY